MPFRIQAEPRLGPSLRSTESGNRYILSFRQPGSFSEQNTGFEITSSTTPVTTGICTCFPIPVTAPAIDKIMVIGGKQSSLKQEPTISLDGVRDKNMIQLKKLNTALFPIRYNDKYYANALASGEFTKLAYYSDICVGAIACRLEKKEGGALRVYIMTLGVLAPYRRLGIGTKLLNHVIDLCQKQNISEIYLHVQMNNEEAVSFFKIFGFEITETIHNYYTNIEPPDRYILKKLISQQPQTKK